MSAPQPPNQPWQGGQPPQGEGGEDQNPALTNAGPTQAIQPGQPLPPHGGQPGADGVERTQAIQPGQQPPAGPDSGATQVVPPGSFGQPQGGDATQMVPPGSMPPQQPPYAPPPGADASSHPGGFPSQPQYGQQPPQGYPQQQGFPGQPQGFPGQQQGFPGQQPPPGYPPQQGFAQQQGLGRGPQFGGQGFNTQYISWALAGVVAIFGLIAAIITLTDFGDISDIAKYLDGVSDEQLEAAEEARDFTAPSVGLLWTGAIVMLLAAVAAIGGGVLIYLKNKIAGMVIAGAAGVLLIASILTMIAEGSEDADINSPVFGIIAAIFIGAVGAMAFIPQTKHFLGGGSALGGPGGGGGFGPPPGGGFGQPPQQPGGFGQPPQQQGFGQPPQGGFGQPPSGGFGQPPQQGGQPPQQW